MPLPISDNLGNISHHFQDMASFPLKMHIFPAPFIRPPIWKCFPQSRLLKFCIPEFHTYG